MGGQGGGKTGGGLVVARGKVREAFTFCSGLGSDPAAAAVADMILVGVGDFCERPVSADGEANVGGIAV